MEFYQSTFKKPVQVKFEPQVNILSLLQLTQARDSALASDGSLALGAKRRDSEILKNKKYKHTQTKSFLSRACDQITNTLCIVLLFKE